MTPSTQEKVAGESEVQSHLPLHNRRTGWDTPDCLKQTSKRKLLFNACWAAKDKYPCSPVRLLRREVWKRRVSVSYQTQGCSPSSTAAQQLGCWLCSVPVLSHCCTSTLTSSTQGTLRCAFLKCVPFTFYAMKKKPPDRKPTAFF